MKLEVNVNVELGQATINALATVLGGTAAAAPAAKKETKPAVAAKATASEDELNSEARGVDTTAKPAAPAPKAATTAPKAATPAPKAAAPAPKAAEEDFDSLDEDGQLEAIKKEITKHTKKGKTGDIKQLLSIFDADRASNLDTAVYGEFYNLVKRYGAGETAEALVEENAV